MTSGPGHPRSATSRTCRSTRSRSIASFVDGFGRDRRATAITQAIVAMAQALSLQVIGEGVETEEQAEALSALGCQLAQGFLFAPPVAPTEIEHMFDGGSGWLEARRART